METIQVESWEELVRRTEELDGWAFRGERSARWPLASSLFRRLSRFCANKNDWTTREARSLRIFRRKAHIYLHDRGALYDDLRALALMQHYGAPTRLIDFTKSPFVAAFFALEEANEDAVVFALNTPALWNAAPDFDPRLTRNTIDPRQPGNFARYFAPNNTLVLWCGEPAEMDQRLIAQSGVFVVPGQVDLPLDEILQHYRAPDPLLRKFVVPLRLRTEAMRSLYRMNITYATLFPGLEGLARSLAYELEVVWAAGADDDAARLPPAGV
ncbi:MAG TPA: FRG domain-containing protein [Burkholderiaceae bacterium]|nr:FRG domain-containing protein [Burkholderiaceae bacterium]